MVGALPGKGSRTEELGQRPSPGPGLQPRHVWVPRGCLGVWDPASLLDTLARSLPLEEGPWAFGGWGTTFPPGSSWRVLLLLSPRTCLPPLYPPEPLGTQACSLDLMPGLCPGRPPLEARPTSHGALLALSDTCFCTPGRLPGSHGLGDCGACPAEVLGDALPAGAVSLVPRVPSSDTVLNLDAHVLLCRGLRLALDQGPPHSS